MIQYDTHQMQAVRDTGFRRTAILAVSISVAIIAAGIGAAWLYLAEPWYDGVIIQKLRSSDGQQSARSGTDRDDTSLINGLFPKGMTHTAAIEILEANGFSCPSVPAWDGQSYRELNCERQLRWICGRKYTIQIFIDRSNVVTDSKAWSNFVCF